MNWHGEFQRISGAIEVAETLDEFLTWGKKHYEDLDSVIRGLAARKITSEYGKNTLMMFTDLIDIWEYLLNLGVDINAVNRNHLTILSKMIIQEDVPNRLGKIRWLLENGADVNLTNQSNDSIFYYAMGHPDVIPILIEYGADFNTVIDTYINLKLHNYSSLYGQEKTNEYLQLLLTLDLHNPYKGGYWSINTIIRYNENFEDLYNSLVYYADAYLEIGRFDDIIEQSLLLTMIDIVSNGYLAMFNSIKDIKFYKYAIHLVDENLNTILHHAINGTENYLGNPILISKLIYDTRDRLDLHQRNIDGITPYNLLMSKPKLFYQYNSKALNENLLLVLEQYRRDPELLFNYIPTDIIHLIEQYLKPPLFPTPTTTNQ